MKCHVCGTEINPQERFCPNCGSPAEQQMPQQQQPEEISPEQTQQLDQQPEEISPEQQIPQPTADPVVQPQPMNDGFGTAPVPGAMPLPEGATAAAPAKKSRKGLILALILIPVVLILAIAICIFVLFRSMYTTSTNAVDAYWSAFTQADGESYAEQVPEQYWDYISETYDFSKEECIAGMELYLQENAEDLGGNLSYEWKKTGFEFNFGDSGSSEGAKDVKEHMETYGIEYTASMGLATDVTVTGDSDTLDCSDTNSWLAKVDGKWYSLNAMIDFESICEEGYVQLAEYQTEFGEPLEAFWTAFYANDLDTIVEMLPEQTWDLLEADFGCDQTTAEEYMQNYLDYVSESLEIQDPESVTMELTVTGVEEAESDEVEEYNDAFSAYGMEVTAVSYITTDCVLTVDGEEESDSFTSTMIQMDGNWYTYDGIYLASESCYEMLYYGSIG